MATSFSTTIADWYGVDDKISELDINTNTQIVYVGDSQDSLVVGDVWFYNYSKILYKKKGKKQTIFCATEGCGYTKDQ